MIAPCVRCTARRRLRGRRRSGSPLRRRPETPMRWPDRAVSTGRRRDRGPDPAADPGRRAAPREQARRGGAAGAGLPAADPRRGPQKDLGAVQGGLDHRRPRIATSVTSPKPERAAGHRRGGGLDRPPHRARARRVGAVGSSAVVGRTRRSEPLGGVLGRRVAPRARGSHWMPRSRPGAVAMAIPGSTASSAVSPW